MREGGKGEQAGEAAGRPRVMVVEDEYVVSLSLKVQLEAIGCEVVGTADNADSAVDMAAQLEPDVVLMDIGLRGKDGVEAIREIMARAPTRIVVVTAYGDERLERALKAGACLVLRKPVLEHQLKDAIEKAIAEPVAESAGTESKGA